MSGYVYVPPPPPVGRVLVMAGGTGGHIFPGLAVAQALKDRGWEVHWLGAPDSMEAELVPAHGFPLERVRFSGVRGKGWRGRLAAVWRLGGAMWQAWGVLRRVNPDVVLGFGGYITVPAGIVAGLSGRPLVLHEQNSVAGMANRMLTRWAKRVFTAFPDVLPGGTWVGNPLRPSFMSEVAPQHRFEGRDSRLHLLVAGGSQGATALNEALPRALALMPEADRPHVVHQSGAAHLDALRQAYAAVGVSADIRPFIKNMAAEMAVADLMVCRAGASTVSEVAAVGVAALMVPFPHAVDDHQTKNAHFLADPGAAWLWPQNTFDAPRLAEFLSSVTRAQIKERAVAAYAARKVNATPFMVQACEELNKT